MTAKQETERQKDRDRKIESQKDRDTEGQRHRENARDGMLLPSSSYFTQTPSLQDGAAHSRWIFLFLSLF